MIDIGLIHFIQKLTSIGRKRFNIAALSLSKDSVKSQATLARTREAGDHHQLISRNYHINIFFSQEDEGYIADIPDLAMCSAFGRTPAEALAEVETAKQVRAC